MNIFSLALYIYSGRIWRKKNYFPFPIEKVQWNCSHIKWNAGRKKFQHHLFPFNLSISHATRTINYFRSIRLIFVFFLFFICSFFYLGSLWSIYVFSCCGSPNLYYRSTDEKKKIGLNSLPLGILRDSFKIYFG